VELAFGVLATNMTRKKFLAILLKIVEEARKIELRERINGYIRIVDFVDL
jgi:hypothetical protein